jgi:hypothetical protein
MKRLTVALILAAAPPTMADSARTLTQVRSAGVRPNGKPHL